MPPTTLRETAKSHAPFMSSISVLKRVKGWTWLSGQATYKVFPEIGHFQIRTTQVNGE